jgi:hypothetical protein
MNILTLHFSTRNFVKIKKKYRLFILEINKERPVLDDKNTCSEGKIA